MRPIDACRLYGILDLGYVQPENLESVTEQMIEGGIDILQLRAKDYTAADMTRMARRVLPLTRDAGVPFIVNDYLQVALSAEANGVHLGQDDQPVSGIRKQVPPGFLIGKSTHSPDQAREAAQEDVDYIGFGPLFATPTKPDYVPIGLEDIALVHEELSLPIFCIGGIKAENAASILHAGAKRLVIVSGILQAPDIPAYIREVKSLLTD